VVVLPNSRDEFSIVKSANRAALALHAGTPVVATRIPSLDPFEHCVTFDDFAGGVAAYLGDQALAAGHVAIGRELLERAYSPRAIATAWHAVVTDLA
jgi:glycosyltransferase involved in cell wall biosynthesis